MFDFDPSKLDPKTLMELSRTIQELPPDQLSRMQTLMHNMAAGFDVRREMEEFEKNLPPGFRERLTSIMASSPPASIGPSESSSEMDLREARLTILRAVSNQEIGPEEALQLLFSGSAS